MFERDVLSGVQYISGYVVSLVALYLCVSMRAFVLVVGREFVVPS